MKLPNRILMVIAFAFLAMPLFAQKSGFPENKIGKIINLYLDIKNALINNDGTPAKIKGVELFQILKGAPDKGLEWRQVKVLTDNLHILLDNTMGICYTVNENEQRHYLAGLTEGVYHLVKDLRVN